MDDVGRRPAVLWSNATMATVKLVEETCDHLIVQRVFADIKATKKNEKPLLVISLKCRRWDLNPHSLA
jgi:hypothetical protein